MSGRTIAFGDIHGCSRALRTLIENIAPTPEDTLVFLGDYVDRGSDSRGVVDQLIELQQRCNLVPLLGNHEIMFLGVVCGGMEDKIWLACGGNATLASYGGALHHIPTRHIDFLKTCRSYWENDRNICVHASYLPEQPMDRLGEQHLFWEHLPPVAPLPHHSGKRVLVGHTPQANLEVLDLGHLVCIDTYCFGGGWLTAFDLDTAEVWQANLHGHARRKFGLTVKRRIREAAQALRQRFSRKQATR
ncbi:metallophosphoesterase family protein [Rosistilla oblonga]|uniref:Serine/threonine-protein phosphatase 1 n=1 Tax=Rosistilla oblonga TaxID=2527990 RepID=A0A518INQ6_9BACT|nr:metallophosphoesterase family protein [Rosistilla oblonga]QDV54692.1 Serine/threonine-protein phosphatase 1 [Rosistilla oblonga]